MVNHTNTPFDAIARALAEGDIPEAKRCLDGLDPSAAETAQAALLAARIALAQGAPHEAKTQLDLASLRGAKAAAVLRIEAQMHRAFNDIPAEYKALEELVAASPTLPNLYALARCCMRAVDLEGATWAAQEGLRQDSACGWAHVILYRVAAERGGAGLHDVLDTAIADLPAFPELPNLTSALQLLPKEERRALADKLSRKWPDDVALRLEFAGAVGDADEVVALLPRLHPAEPDQILYIGQLVRRLVFLRAVPDALSLARKAAATYPANPEAHHMLYATLAQTAGRKEVAQALRDAIASPAAYPKFKQLRLALSALEPEEAADLKTRLITRWPDAAQDLEVRRSKFSQAIELTLSGHRDAALLSLSQHDTAEEEAELLDAVALIKALPDPADLKRPIVVDTSEEVVMSRPSANGVTVLFFTGIADRVGLDYEAVDAFCAASGAASIYLRDTTKMIFLMGVKSLAPDRAGTVAALRKQLDAIGTRELIVVGSSGGSYSSVTYGLELGASRIIGLGAQTSIHHFLKPGGDPRARLMIERIKDQFDPDLLDLRKLWQTFPIPPRLDLYFAAENRNDATHANHMAGLDNVFLHPFAGVQRHDIIHVMVQLGMLSDLFDPGATKQLPTG